MILVMGGSGSGKSEWAENRAVSEADKGRLCYLATMSPKGSEAAKRIERHRHLREGKGFDTIEETENVSAALDKAGRSDTVLLEDLSNLLANIRYGSGLDFEAAEEKIISDIDTLSEGVGELIIVSNDIFSDGCVYDRETRQFMETMAKLNERFADRAHTVVEVVAGICIYHKKQ